MVRKSLKQYIIGTTWDIKKPSINSPYKNRDYFKKIGDKETYNYWVRLIKIRKKMRDFLDIEWENKKHLVKSKEDFIRYVQIPAEKKIEKYYGVNIRKLHYGDI